MKVSGTLSGLLFYVLIVSIFLSSVYLGNEATEAVANLIPLERDHTIVLDAGHGGEDGGAVSCTGMLESRYNLEITRALNDLFHLLGYETRMIRTMDTAVYTSGHTLAQKKISDLKERVRIVNETEGALLVSIHQNTFSDSKYSGAQVFYGDSDKGRELADQLQASLCGTVNPGSNRKSKVARGIYLMEHIDCPGILVECGFLSNPDEEAKLRDSSYQKKLACVIGAAVCNFLDR